MKKLLLFVLVAILLGSFSAYFYNSEKIKELKTDIVLDYLKLNAQLSEFWSDFDIDNEELITRVLYISERVDKDNKELQETYAPYRDIKIAKRKTIGDFLDSVNDLVNYYSSWVEGILAGRDKEETNVQFQLMEDAFLHNAMYVVWCVTTSTKNGESKVSINRKQKEMLLEYIQNVFGDDLEVYKDAEIKPVYIWGIILMKGFLEGKNLEKAVKN